MSMHYYHYKCLYRDYKGDHLSQKPSVHTLSRKLRVESDTSEPKHMWYRAAFLRKWTSKILFASHFLNIHNIQLRKESYKQK
mgnify:CR=1 FL=1